MHCLALSPSLRPGDMRQSAGGIALRKNSGEGTGRIHPKVDNSDAGRGGDGRGRGSGRGKLILGNDLSIIFFGCIAFFINKCQVD